MQLWLEHFGVCVSASSGVLAARFAWNSHGLFWNLEKENTE